MEAIFDIPNPADETQGEKMSSLNHSDLQTRLGYLLMAAYRQQYSIYTELDFASGKTRPALCIMPKRKAKWLADEIVLHDAPLTTIEILSPEQSLNQLTERIYSRHFSAGVKTVWLVVPAVQTVSILLPERKQVVFSQGSITDPVTNIQLSLNDIFEE